MATALRNDGTRIEPGTVLTNDRKEHAKFEFASRGAKGSPGLITVKWLDGRLKGRSGTYYPGVFGLPPVSE